MIYVDRALGEPAGLVRRRGRGDDAAPEARRVVREVRAHLEAAGVDHGLDADGNPIVPATTSDQERRRREAAMASFSFRYQAYKDDDVKESLRQLFHGKCAYCESRYAGTQPMDVEHYRPKGRITDLRSGTSITPGYYWLASAWHNLLPSCIDCNRRRNHAMGMRGGKADLFPLEDEELRVRWHGDDLDGDARREQPLLLHPCIDSDVDRHLRFGFDGRVEGLTERGRASIEVFGLMRPELVVDRRQVARLVEFRLDLTAALTDVRDRLECDGAPVDDPGLVLVEEVIILVLRELEGMAAADQPYAGMVRQLLVASGMTGRS